MEMPVDILNQRLGKLRDNGDIDFDNTAVAVDIDSELQEKFLFFPIAELEELEEQIETSRDMLYLGQGTGYINVLESDKPEDLFTKAENALALYWHLKKKADAEKDRLAKRPEPGVYQGKSASYFTVLVTEDRRVLVQQTSGGFADLTEAWDKGTAGRYWGLQRINITDGTVSA